MWNELFFTLGLLGTGGFFRKKYTLRILFIQKKIVTAQPFVIDPPLISLSRTSFVFRPPLLSHQRGASERSLCEPVSNWIPGVGNSARQYSVCYRVYCMYYLNYWPLNAPITELLPPNDIHYRWTPRHRAWFLCFSYSQPSPPLLQRKFFIVASPTLSSHPRLISHRPIRHGRV